MMDIPNHVTENVAECSKQSHHFKYTSTKGFHNYQHLNILNYFIIKKKNQFLVVRK